MMEGIRFARKYGLNFVEVGSSTLFYFTWCHVMSYIQPMLDSIPFFFLARQGLFWSYHTSVSVGSGQARG